MMSQDMQITSAGLADVSELISQAVAELNLTLPVDNCETGSTVVTGSVDCFIAQVQGLSVRWCQTVLGLQLGIGTVGAEFAQAKLTAYKGGASVTASSLGATVETVLPSSAIERLAARCVLAYAQQAELDNPGLAAAPTLAGPAPSPASRRIQEILTDLNSLARQRQAADQAVRPVLDMALAGNFPMDSGSGDGGDSGNRDDDSRGSGRDSSDEPPVTGPAIPGGNFYDNGLGTPYAGIALVGWPDPPIWFPNDDDSGEWGSQSADIIDIISYHTVVDAAISKLNDLPDAAMNLMHYLGNTGTDWEQPVDKIIADVPSFADAISQEEQRLAAEAVRQAQATGATTSLVFPICTQWYHFSISQAESEDWFLATGSFDYSLTGWVTVYPPDQPGDPWSYKMATAVNFHDRYNWDANAGKLVEIAGITITDADMNQLSLVGLAKNFNMYGQSSVRSSQGEI